MPDEDEVPPEGRPEDESLPKGWLNWLHTHARRLLRISTEIGKLTEENRRLRADVQRLADQVNRHAGQLDQVSETIQARVEAEVLKRLDRLHGDRGNH